MEKTLIERYLHPILTRRTPDPGFVPAVRLIDRFGSSVARIVTRFNRACGRFD